MMETKLWIALCALLVIHWGSATPDDNHTAALSSKTGINASVPDPVPSSTNHSLSITQTGPGSNGTSSLNSTSASITITPNPRKNNVIINASEATSAKIESITNPALSPSQSHATTPVFTHAGPTHITQTPSFLSTSVTPNPSSNQNVSQHQNNSDKPSQAKALPTSSTPISEPPKLVSTTIANTTTKSTATTTTTKSTATTTTTKSSTTSTSSSQKSTTSQLTTNTSQSDRQSADTMARDSPALDPLLAGLVSAFIIAAVIITLLLFLKLRRRGNRPEFRRLQDLPMDDMEDTPLSMYSY